MQSTAVFKDVGARVLVMGACRGGLSVSRPGAAPCQPQAVLAHSKTDPQQDTAEPIHHAGAPL